MPQFPGVYKTFQKDGSISHRASFTYKSKHISLGSYSLESSAAKAYETAVKILREKSFHLEDYKDSYGLAFDKWVILMNLRDNGIYFKNPIYLRKRYFIYYVTWKTQLKFDVDDLFYYAKHKIMKRGGHLFVSDYGMQVNILSRYGIRNYAVAGRDYRFVNGDALDYRYGNIEIVNPYYGVTKSYYKGLPIFTTKIHIHGDFIVGRYSSEIHAAIAYNKAAGILRDKGILKDFPENYIPELGEIEYAKIYNMVRVSKKVRDF